MEATVTQLLFSTHGTQEANNLIPVRPSSQSVVRFEQILNAPSASSQVHGVQAASASSKAHAVQASFSPALPQRSEEIVNRVRKYAEEISAHWDANQKMVDRIARMENISTKDLLLVQQALINGAMHFELSSKAAGMIEQGMQTLTQRS